MKKRACYCGHKKGEHEQLLSGGCAIVILTGRLCPCTSYWAQRPTHKPRRK